MDWKFLFESNTQKMNTIYRLNETLHDELGSEMNPEDAISSTVNVLMDLCIAAGMNKDDFSAMLDEIDDEYVGW
jgi:hypothetical protein